MLTNINFLQSKPEFEVFSYANRAFDKQKKLSSDSKIKETSKAILSILSIFSSTAADLMTVSFRFANHLKTLDDYNQSFNLRRPLSKVNRYFKKLDYKLGKLDVRELDYKPFSLTSRLIVELEKIPKSSKIKKIITKALIIAAAQFAVIIDIIALPARHYSYLKVVVKNKEKMVRQNNAVQISMIALLSFSLPILIAENSFLRGYNDAISSTNSFLLCTTILFGIVSIAPILLKSTGNSNVVNLQRNLRNSHSQNLQLYSYLEEAEDGNLVLLGTNRSLKARIEQMEKDKPVVKPVEYGKIPPDYIIMSDGEGNKKCSCCFAKKGIDKLVTHLKTSADLHGVPCSIFCRDCIDEWLKQPNGYNCPVCRETITKNSLRSVEVFPPIPSRYGVRA